jgi:hypothetical protein
MKAFNEMRSAFAAHPQSACSLVDSDSDSDDEEEDECLHHHHKRKNCGPAKKKDVIWSGPRCCSKGCCTKWRPGQIEELRRQMSHKNEYQTRVFVSHRVFYGEDEEESDGQERRNRRFFLDKRIRTPLRDQLDERESVCVRYMCWALDISTNVIYQPRTKTKRMQVTRAPRMEGQDYSSLKSVAIVTWLVLLGSYYQFDPTSALVFLPFGARWIVHSLYMSDQEDNPHNVPEVSETYFLHCWRHNPDTKHIRLRKHLRFALCDECLRLREAQEAARGDPEAMAKVRKDVRAHRDFVRQQRRSYYRKRNMARDDPDTYLSLILDAADQVGDKVFLLLCTNLPFKQAAYALPYFCTKTHSSDGIKLRSHLMGCIAHGRQAYAYTFWDNFKHGTNVTIEAMYRVLVDLRGRGKLPPRFFLQLDNTAKQCKSRFMIGFLAYLCLLGVFQTIVVSFLPVGHTHEDIDQMFSR